MKRLLILPVVTVVCVAETYRRGYVAPLLFGCRQWSRARSEKYFELHPMA